jgi:hypothetical protein
MEQTESNVNFEEMKDASLALRQLGRDPRNASLSPLVYKSSSTYHECKQIQSRHDEICIMLTVVLIHSS